MGFELSADYIDVATRIAEFEQKHPEGRLRPVNPDEPYKLEAIGGEFFIVYTAAAYRSADDPLPGIGVAWERFPGKTPYTKDSELQNAETSAWGRAIVAALASRSKHVASAEDVRNRQADNDVKPVKTLVTPEGETVHVWPGEVDANTAKGELLAALGGDKDAAGKAWTAAKLDGKVKVARDVLDPLLALMRGGSKVGAGAEPDTTGMPQDAGDAQPATSPGVQPGVKAAEAPAPNVIDARAVAQRANALFEAAIGDGYPARKKTWVNEQLRHSLVYLSTNGERTSSGELEGAQFLAVWRLLDALENGKLKFAWSADPGKGVTWTWPDGSSTEVRWVDLNLAEAGAS